MGFSFEVYDDERDQIVTLIGDIDEQADFGKIPLAAGKRLVLDLRGVQMLNSVGLRSWVLWVRRLDRPEGIFLRHCPPNVVHQMNILEGFLPMAATVESFQVPYHCEFCGTETRYTAERGRDFTEAQLDQKEKVSLPETLKCSNCGEEAPCDIIPVKYLKFLNRRGPR